MQDHIAERTEKLVTIELDDILDVRDAAVLLPVPCHCVRRRRCVLAVWGRGSFCGLRPASLRATCIHATVSPPARAALQYKGDKEFAEEIICNTRRYVELFSEVLDELVKSALPSDNAIRSDEVADVLLAHRMQQIAAQANASAEASEGDAEAAIPPLPTRLTRRCVRAVVRARLRFAIPLACGSVRGRRQCSPRVGDRVVCGVLLVGTCRFEVRFLPLSADSKPMALRNVRAADIGHLVSVKAICTRTSDVKPLISVVTYACDVCGFEIYQNVSPVWCWCWCWCCCGGQCPWRVELVCASRCVAVYQVNAKSFLPLKECPSKSCKDNKSTGRLHMQVPQQDRVITTVARRGFLLDRSPKSSDVHALATDSRLQVCEIPRGEDPRAAGAGARRTHSSVHDRHRTGRADEIGASCGRRADRQQPPRPFAAAAMVLLCYSCPVRDEPLPVCCQSRHCTGLVRCRLCLATS